MWGLGRSTVSAQLGWRLGLSIFVANWNHKEGQALIVFQGYNIVLDQVNDFPNGFGRRVDAQVKRAIWPDKKFKFCICEHSRDLLFAVPDQLIVLFDPYGCAIQRRLREKQ